MEGGESRAESPRGGGYGRDLDGPRHRSNCSLAVGRRIDSTGGSLPTHPPHLTIRAKSIILGALALQVLAIASREESLTRVALLLSYPALIVGCLMNFRTPGVALMLLGVVLNFAAILANGGLMPVAVDHIGTPPVEGFVPGTKSVVLHAADIRLPLLTDRFGLPLPALQAKVFSLGDALIAAGLLVAGTRTLVSLVPHRPGRGSHA